ncbi:MAG: preprotein translocase subunit SecA [Elusimicrobiota bacterium]
MIKFIYGLLYGSKNKRELRKLQPFVESINELEEEIEKLSDIELADKTAEFRKRIIESGETLDEILPEAFAVAREASKRTLKLRPFDVQLIGGMVLHKGNIAEMKTGEGKTLVATLPVYLNALTGKGVHVVTVNDYLAKRDCTWMSPIYQFLGLTVGFVQHDMADDIRKKMYGCDITYVTNNEIGFDYLRDNMKFRSDDRVLRGLNYAIVDEVDSILIDEARTPLIISGPAEESTDKYHIINRVVPQLKGRFVTESEEIDAKHDGIDLSKGYDYVADEKNHTISLTEQGVTRSEWLLGVKNLYDDIQSEWVHHITQALRAHKLYKRDVDYVVKDGEIIIVDEFTGRLMPGRRWSDGLHQAIEAKENMRIAEENQTLATITFQNFFKLYGKTAGMTGTAATSANEFWGVYKLDVVIIPTNKPMIRKDYPDIIYKTEREKYNAIVSELDNLWRKGQPVLVGTRSIEKSEHLSMLLRKKGIPHNVLNAKYHEMEAQIISQAGHKGAVTIATNMAGRGTDIVLGGNPPVEEDVQHIKDVGGLHVLGTERHEARRIDDQLRGRTGRQGDPGSSRFYLSLEDELMRLFGSDRIKGVMDKLGMQEGDDIQHPFVTKALESAQARVEAMNYDIRKNLLEFDKVMSRQREAIYGLRDSVIEGSSVPQRITEMINEAVEEKVEGISAGKKFPEEWDWQVLDVWTQRMFGFTQQRNKEEIAGINKEELRKKIEEEVNYQYKHRENEFGSDVVREMERMVLLQMIDTCWKDHLYNLDQLRRGIGLRAYGQKDPVIEYKQESLNQFELMLQRISDSTVEYMFRIQPVREPVRRVPIRTIEHRGNEGESSAAKLQGTQGNNSASSSILSSGKASDNVPKTVKKIGNNDPCWCGSGKKYKKCCKGKE